MNSNTITIVIAAVSVILAIFGASWLNQRSLKDYIDARFDAMRAEIQAVRTEFRAEIGPLRIEVANLSSRVDRIERQLEAIFKPVFPKSGD